MAKKTQSYIEPQQPSLKVSHEEAEHLLLERMQKGVQLRDSVINSENELERIRAEYNKWNDYNGELLKKIFNCNTLADEYSSSSLAYIIDIYAPLSKDIDDFRRDVQDKLDTLDSIKDRLPLFDIKENHDNALPTKKDNGNNKVFIVHGHNDTIKLDVARTLEKLGIETMILHEQANEGKTIIEKLESNSDVGFAVIILSPDDEGKAKTENNLRDRARQNVIAELGYFIGKLGRNKVCTLFIEGIEIPSDFNGVTYVPLDPSGRWKFDLARELKAAGYNVDLNKII